jgi:hypothetical protein
MPDILPLRRVVKWLSIALGLVAIVFYVLFQARYLIGGPEITLTSHEPHLQNSRQVLLTGQAFNISHLWLNDRQIFTNAEGYFEEALILENGYTIATLRAEDRYGRETTVTETYVYSPTSFIQ